MIHSKQDLKDYLKADLIANKMKKSSLLRYRISGNYIMLYLWYLRHLEYSLNSNKSFGGKVWRVFLRRRMLYWGAFTGITIPPNTFGKGLYIPHWGAIVVNGSARFGDYCVVQSGVNISEGVKGGNHIYLAAGAKLLIGVSIADDVIVAANAVVNKNVVEQNVVVGGVPAKKISNNGFRNRQKV